MDSVEFDKWHLANGRPMGSDGFFKGTVECDLLGGGWKYIIKFYDRRGNILSNAKMQSAKEVKFYVGGEKDAVMNGLKILVDDLFEAKDVHMAKLKEEDSKDNARKEEV